MSDVLNFIAYFECLVQMCRASYYILAPQVPLSWYKLWEGPLEPMQYIRSMIAKALALKVWQEKGEQGTLLQGEALDLSELFHPDTFLNALRQQTARYGHISIDTA